MFTVLTERAPSDTAGGDLLYPMLLTGGGLSISHKVDGKNRDTFRVISAAVGRREETTLIQTHELLDAMLFLTDVRALIAPAPGTQPLSSGPPRRTLSGMVDTAGMALLDPGGAVGEAVASASSKLFNRRKTAPATVPTRGTRTVGQVRYQWIQQVSIRKDPHGERLRILMLDATEQPEQDVLLELRLPEGSVVDAATRLVHRCIRMQAARFPATVDQWAAFSAHPPVITAGPEWMSVRLPTYLKVRPTNSSQPGPAVRAGGQQRPAAVSSKRDRVCTNPQCRSVSVPTRLLRCADCQTATAVSVTASEADGW